MAATTVTTIIMILFGLGVLTMASYAWFGSWQPEPRRLTAEERLEREFAVAVREMRQAIERYEREG